MQSAVNCVKIGGKKTGGESLEAPFGNVVDSLDAVIHVV